MTAHSKLPSVGFALAGLFVSGFLFGSVFTAALTEAAKAENRVEYKYVCDGQRAERGKANGQPVRFTCELTGFDGEGSEKSVAANPAERTNGLSKPEKVSRMFDRVLVEPKEQPAKQGEAKGERLNVHVAVSPANSPESMS